MDLREARKKREKLKKEANQIPTGEPKILLEVIINDYVAIGANSFKPFGNALTFAFHSQQEALKFDQKLRTFGYTMDNPAPGVIATHYPPYQIGRSTIFDVDIINQINADREKAQQIEAESKAKLESVSNETEIAIPVGGEV